MGLECIDLRARALAALFPSALKGGLVDLRIIFIQKSPIILNVIGDEITRR